jgi:hypothetical protein
MGETAPFRRTWRVTITRGLVACVPAVALAVLAATGQPEANRLSQFGVSMLALVGTPAFWLILRGAWLDHQRAARGPGYLLIAHVGGSVAALGLVVVGSVVFDILTGREGLNGLSLVFWILFVPPWVTVGFLVAWLVPGSFPRGAPLGSATSPGSVAS